MDNVNDETMQKFEKRFPDWQSFSEERFGRAWEVFRTDEAVAHGKPSGELEIRIAEDKRKVAAQAKMVDAGRATETEKAFKNLSRRERAQLLRNPEFRNTMIGLAQRKKEKRRLDGATTSRAVFKDRVEELTKSGKAKAKRR